VIITKHADLQLHAWKGIGLEHNTVPVAALGIGLASIRVLHCGPHQGKIAAGTPPSRRSRPRPPPAWASRHRERVDLLNAAVVGVVAAHQDEMAC